MVQFLLSYPYTLNSFTDSFHSEVCKCILVLTLANSYHICAVDLSQMLTRPNKAETAVRVYHSLGDMAVRMREVNKEKNTYLIGLSSRGFSESIGIWKCCFLRRGEKRSTRGKTAWSKEENQQHDETQVGLDWKYPISELIKLRFTGRLNFCQQKEINPYQIGLTCRIK